MSPKFGDFERWDDWSGYQDFCCDYIQDILKSMIAAGMFMVAWKNEKQWIRMVGAIASCRQKWSQGNGQIDPFPLNFKHNRLSKVLLIWE